MNTDLLWLLLPSALALGGVLLWRLRRRRPTARAQARPAAQASAAPAPPARPSAIEAQRLAATEALRQARLRKAEQAASLLRQQAEPQAAVAAPPAATVVGRALPPPPPQAMPAARAPAVAVVGAIAPPIERSRASAAPIAKHTAASTAAHTPAYPVRPTSPPTVLLADDSKLVRVKTGRLLQQQGWQVLLAEDGLAAWSQLEASTIDLLITDVEMPGLDGFELTRRLRDDPRWRDLPVIMISGSDERHLAAARASGVNLLLGKPYAEAHLLAQAQRLIGRRVAPAEAGLASH